MSNEKAKTILIIEDEEDIRFTLKYFLESEGYAVLTAANGLEGLELLEQKGVPHLILLDMKMPIMNGWEFALEFQKKYDQQSPIVVMTAAADAEKRSKDIGAVTWIEKPCDLDIILEKIRHFEL